MADEPRPLLPESLHDPRPMLATDGRSTTSTTRGRSRGKWDGYRIIARYVDGRLRLSSRSGHRHDRRFPGVGRTLSGARPDVVLDGEVVALRLVGAHQFHAIEFAAPHTDEPYRLKLFLFDILALAGNQSLLSTPWEQRRTLSGMVPLPPLPARRDPSAAARSGRRGGRRQPRARV